MADVTDFTERSGTPPARRALARYLRELAEIIEADESETAPNAALVVLTGRTRHEVLHVGNNAEPGFIRGAILAAQAVYTPHYDTAGGNIRPRTHNYGFGRAVADLVQMRPRAAQEGGE